MGVLNFLSSIGKGIASNDHLRDYKHASRTFTSNNYALLPKTKRWWHVYFEINESAVQVLNNVRNDILLSGNFFRGLDVDEYGGNAYKFSVLAKTVKLPNFRYETKRYNQYNRQIIGVNKITYDPINLEFHDDASNIVRNFWQWYYLYHTQDSRYAGITKNLQQGVSTQIPEWRQDESRISNLMSTDASGQTPFSSIYSNFESFSTNWGLDTVNSKYQNKLALDRFSPFLSCIKIYHFSRAVNEDDSPSYSEYTLVNPIITSFEHDTLDYTSSEGATNRLTLEYETVLYNQGKLPVDDFAASEIASWDQVQKYLWDSSKSPLSNPQANILGKSGIVETAGGVLGGLAAGNVGGLLTAGVTAGKAVQTWKNVGGVNGIINSAKQEGKQFLNTTLGEISKTLGPQQRINVPNGNEKKIGIKEPQKP